MNTENRTRTNDTHAEGDLDMNPNALVLACRRVRPMARHRRTRARRAEGRLARPLASSAGGPLASTHHDLHDAHPKDTAMNTNAFTTPIDAVHPTATPENAMHAPDRDHVISNDSTPTTTSETPMHDPTDSTTNPPNIAPATIPPASTERVAASREPRPFEPRVLRKPLEPEDLFYLAQQELDWLHSPAAQDPCHAGRRAVLLGWLGRLSGVHRGILALGYDRRRFSPVLAGKLTSSQALVVRVDCAAHPMRGTAEEAERASVARLEALVLAGKERPLAALCRRAGERFHEAVEAFGSVRGNVACVVPPERASQAKAPVPTPGDETA